MNTDHYIECSECGHPIERHIGLDSTQGCDTEGCACGEEWDVRGVAYTRRRAGLTDKWILGTI